MGQNMCIPTAPIPIKAVERCILPEWFQTRTRWEGTHQRAGMDQGAICTLAVLVEEVSLNGGLHTSYSQLRRKSYFLTQKYYSPGILHVGIPVGICECKRFGWHHWLRPWREMDMLGADVKKSYIIPFLFMVH